MERELIALPLVGAIGLGLAGLRRAWVRALRGDADERLAGLRDTIAILQDEVDSLHQTYRRDLLEAHERLDRAERLRGGGRGTAAQSGNTSDATSIESAPASRPSLVEELLAIPSSASPSPLATVDGTHQGAIP